MAARSVCGVGLRAGRIDFDAAFEMSAVFNADPGGGNIADDRPVFADIDTTASAEVPNDLAENDDSARFYFGIEQGVGADGEFVTAKRNGAFDGTVDLKILGADDLTLDAKR